MSSVLVIVTFIISIILITVNINKFMHIFQQSFYQLDDFLPAIKTTKVYRMQGYEVSLLLFTLVSIWNQSFLMSYAFIALYAAYKTINNRAVAKKKFVYTTRVKITYCVIAMLILLSLIGVSIFATSKYILIVFAIMSLYKFIAIALVLLGNLIAKPLLTVLNQRYIKEAKQIINSNKNLKIIGITGSYGKTSTKNIVTALLEEKYITVMTPKSYNTTLGVVKTIREQIKPYTEVFVCEMGASRLKDIEDICKVVKPDISVITSIGPQHLTTFKSMDNIVKGKYEIITEAKKDVKAILNVDNEYIKSGIEKYAKDIEVIEYAINDKNVRYTVENITMSDKGSIFDIVDGENKIQVETKLLGKHNIYNIVCAVAIAKELGMTNAEIKKGIKRIKPVEHRLELKKMGGILALDDSFNSNPEGSKMAIETLCMFKDKYKVLVTPGMIELGEKTDELNKKLGEYATALDYVILVGKVTTDKIKEGMDEKGFKNYVVVDDLYEAFRKLEEIQISNKNLLALFENDLPDSYIK
ncbi:MAG: UDP-N-acetylmuramoyl-tripeptide--D-alanyl-D-alanine ligase [Clostridia bacterium]|nr:UDP-N-acetylmuramoyl-tripeptide--D-alanyl-D-alanine ligase [Clostridia bacterium]